MKFIAFNNVTQDSMAQADTADDCLQKMTSRGVPRRDIEIVRFGENEVASAVWQHRTKLWKARKRRSADVVVRAGKEVANV